MFGDGPALKDSEMSRKMVTRINFFTVTVADITFSMQYQFLSCDVYKPHTRKLFTYAPKSDNYYEVKGPKVY
jgi:hypothetical protein